MGGTTKRVLVNQHKLGDTGKLHACAIFHLRPFLVDSAEFAKQVKRAFCCIIYYVIDESSVIIFFVHKRGEEPGLFVSQLNNKTPLTAYGLHVLHALNYLQPCTNCHCTKRSFANQEKMQAAAAAEESGPSTFLTRSLIST